MTPRDTRIAMFHLLIRSKNFNFQLNYIFLPEFKFVTQEVAFNVTGSRFSQCTFSLSRPLVAPLLSSFFTHEIPKTRVLAVLYRLFKLFVCQFLITNHDSGRPVF